MKIRVTKKLKDAAHLSPQTYEEGDAFYSWHANVVVFKRKKAIVVVNDKTRFAVVIYPVRAREFKMLDDLIAKAIVDTLRDASFSLDVIKSYMLDSGDSIVWTKSGSRSHIARMNSVCGTFYFLGDYMVEHTIIQTETAHCLNDFPFGDSHDFRTPEERMNQELKELTGKAPVSCRAAKMHITLGRDENIVTRTLIVPLNMTFNQFHKVLQIAFDWKDYHIHDFIIYQMEKAVLNLVQNEEDSDFSAPFPRRLEQGVLLSDYIPAYTHFVYTYDFGDGWEHSIEVLDVLDEYDSARAVCLDGEGDAPPEDVGGEPGFARFLQITADPQHPEYRELTMWGISQGYKEFSRESINMKLSHMSW